MRGVRANGELRARFVRAVERTRVASLYEAGGLRLKFPRAARSCEAIVVNTAGGIVGGDRAKMSFAASEGASVLLTTQSAEKIYRSDGATARVDVALTLASHAQMHWLPQETIFFDRARLCRRLEVDLASNASLTVLETLIFGRLGMGEVAETGMLADDWRVRRDGTLIFAEALRLGEDIREALDRSAGGGGARAIATLLHVSPTAERLVDGMRDIASGTEVDAGISAWNGLLVGRLASPSPSRLRACIVAVLTRLRGAPSPRVWQ